jgi:NTE family protein
MIDANGPLGRLARMVLGQTPRQTPLRPPAPATRSGTWCFALQGGGPLGAFTWGVLEMLLSEGRLQPAAFSGASAGAVNAAVLATHWTTDGPEAALAALEKLWRKVSDGARFTPFGDFPLMPKAGSDWGSAAVSLATRMFSPYQLNPLGHNPLREILAEAIDPEVFRDPRCPRLFVSATRVSDGGCRIFTNEDLSLDAILASAALPFLHQAVEVDGESYWDGGYTANPPLRALASALPGTPILLVELMPRHGEGLPKTAAEITQRLNQIVFSRPLLDELEALRERAEPPVIEEIGLGSLPEGAAPSLDWAFLERLRRDGRTAAETWLRTPA